MAEGSGAKGALVGFPPLLSRKGKDEGGAQRGAPLWGASFLNPFYNIPAS